MMRTTIRLDDDLEKELRSMAATEGLSFGKLVNRLLRQRLQGKGKPPSSPRRYREPPAHMGEPRIDLTKALDLADQLEAEETAHKLGLRK
jgi:hypothetical protein